MNSCEPREASYQGVLSPRRSSSCYWWSPGDRCAPHIPQCKSCWSSAICHSSVMATTSAWRRSLIGRASAWPPSSSRHSAKWPSRSPRSSATRSVRARWQARLTPLGGAGFQGEAEPWHRFHSRTAGLHGCAAGAVGNIQRVCQANQEDPLEIVSPSAATAGDVCGSGGGKWKSPRSLSMKRICSSPLPRNTCPRSMHLLGKQAAQAWQWRRVALHGGYEGLARGAVFAPLRRALTSARLTNHEQAYLRSVVDGGWWPPMR